MTESAPSFFSRIALAIGAFFSIIGNPAFAARVRRARQAGDDGDLAPAPAATAPAAPLAPAVVLREATPDAALQLLGLMQREARFVDFLQEDVTAYSDTEIGAAARLVHDGCRKVLHEHFTLVPAHGAAEGSTVLLEAGFDAAAIRLTGNVVGQPPFRGTLSHRGWRITEVRLPRLAPKHDAHIVAAAEVEL